MAEVVAELTFEVTVKGRIIGDNGSVQVVDERYVQQFTDGSGADQVAKVIYNNALSSSTTSVDMDLGTVLDYQGAAAAITKVKALYVRNKHATADLIIKQGGSNPITTILGGTSPTLTIGPDSICLILNPDAGGWTASSGADTIAIETTAASQPYTILAAGGIG